MKLASSGNLTPVAANRQVDSMRPSRLAPRCRFFGLNFRADLSQVFYRGARSQFAQPEELLGL